MHSMGQWRFRRRLIAEAAAATRAEKKKSAGALSRRSCFRD